MLAEALELVNVPTVAVFLFSLWAVWGYRKSCPPGGLPPGPKCQPFIGNLNLLRNNPRAHLTVNQLGKKYGAIFSLQLGWYPAVVINDYALMKEALLKQAQLCENRFTHIIFVKLAPSFALGILNADGQVWKMSRRLALGQLRNYGMGKAGIEPKIMSEVEPLIQQIYTQRGEAFDIVEMFISSITNIICAMLFNKGERYTSDDADFVEIVKTMRHFMQMENMNYDLPIMVPYLLPLMFLNTKTMRIMSSTGKLEAHIKKLLKQDRADFNPDQLRDFIDLYLKGKSEGHTEVEYSEENFVRLINDIMFAGPETTIRTLSWVILFLLREPEVQDRCRADILSVVGTDRPLTLNDRSSLPYIEATICEAQRLGNTAPLSVMHCTAGEVTLKGYTIPDKTLLIPDIFSVHMDPELWTDPDRFDPGRFLDDDGKLRRPNYFMPFGIGTRACPGDTLAKEELFLFVGSILQKFELRSPDDQTLPTIYDGVYGITLSPAPFKVIANPLQL